MHVLFCSICSLVSATTSMEGSTADDRNRLQEFEGGRARCGDGKFREIYIYMCIHIYMYISYVLIILGRKKLKVTIGKEERDSEGVINKGLSVEPLEVSKFMHVIEVHYKDIDLGILVVIVDC
jgi:hypothetical protein